MQRPRGAAAVLAAMIILTLTPPSGAAPPGPLELAKVGFKLESAVPGDWAGFGLTVGDFDGDGVLDLAVGAWCDSSEEPGNGAVYVLYGPITPDRSLADADAILLGSGGGFGENLVALDLDGDGADELVVGSPGAFIGLGPLASQCITGLIGHTGLNRAGEVYVFRGGQRLSGRLDATTAADSVITGYAPGDFAGWDVGGGDLTGDGRAELVVGANAAAAFTGAAFLFSGGVPSAGTTALDADGHVLGDRPMGEFGLTIATGDIDGDGVADLLIGGPSQFAGEAGAIYVFLGGQVPTGVNLASAADITLEGIPGDAAGAAITVADLDGDGAPDLVVGAPSGNTTYAFYGPIDRRGTIPLSDADVRISAGEGRLAGKAVAVVNLDGGDRSDLVIGAPWDDTVQDAGAVHRLVGPLTGDIDAMTTGFVYVGEIGDEAGFALAVGDVTGNGVDDLIVGAPANAIYLQPHLTFTETFRPGGVYVIPGRSGECRRQEASGDCRVHPDRSRRADGHVRPRPGS